MRSQSAAPCDKGKVNNMTFAQLYEIVKFIGQHVTISDVKIIWRRLRTKFGSLRNVRKDHVEQELKLLRAEVVNDAPHPPVR